MDNKVYEVTDPEQLELLKDLPITQIIGTIKFTDPLTKHLEQTVNKSWNYAGRCSEWKDHVLNAVLGLSGEAGELADQHKKMFFHTEIDYKFHLEKIKHELGDVAFYFIKLIELHGLTLEEVIEANKQKLESRHPELGKVETRFGEGYIK